MGDYLDGNLCMAGYSLSRHNEPCVCDTIRMSYQTHVVDREVPLRHGANDDELEVSKLCRGRQVGGDRQCNNEWSFRKYTVVDWRGSNDGPAIGSREWACSACKLEFHEVRKCCPSAQPHLTPNTSRSHRPWSLLCSDADCRAADLLFKLYILYALHSTHRLLPIDLSGLSALRHTIHFEDTRFTHQDP